MPSSLNSNKTIYSTPQKMRETNKPINYAHITWDHLGNKFHIHLNQNDMLEGNDIVEVLYGKASCVLPEFKGVLAFEDESGHEIFLNNDSQLRSILSRRGNRLRIHTTLTGTTPSHLAASEFFEGSIAGDREVHGRETDTKNVNKRKPLPPGKIKTPVSTTGIWPFPIFIRGSWIGPNKFIGGGYWGGIGPIPSNRYWQTAAGGRPPW